MLLLIFFSILSVNAGPPVFNDDASNITAKENTILKVKCSAVGDPKPTYDWYNEHGDEVGPHLNPPVWVEGSADNYSLLVFNTTSKNHSGAYQCIAKNSHGLRSKVFEVNVIERENEVNIRVLNVTKSSVTFGFSPHGQNATFELKYKETYQDRTLYRRFTDKDATVEVKGLLPSGRYSFNFTQSAGGWQRTLGFTVVLLPEAPEFIFHSLNGGMLTFSWFRTIEDVMRKTIDKYLLSYRTVWQVGGRSWNYSGCNISVEIPMCAPTQYTLANLAKATWYEIRLSAHTSAGYGKPYTNKVYIS